MADSPEQNSLALPGFEALVSEQVDRAGAMDLSDANRYTAATLMKNYPGTFRSIAAALFKYRLPTSVIIELYHVSAKTVTAIHDLVITTSAQDGRGGFLAKCRAASTKSIVICRLVEAIRDKLDDPKVLKEMSVAELTDVLKKLDPSDECQDKQPGAKPVTIVHDGEDFDAVIDGLCGGKNPARLCPSARLPDAQPPDAETDCGAPSASPSKCSTGTVQDGATSFSMSNATLKTLGVLGALCNLLCNPVGEIGIRADSAADLRLASAAAEWSAPGARIPAPCARPQPGAGGTPPAAAQGGYATNAFAASGNERR